jgi:hypothetical protein
LVTPPILAGQLEGKENHVRRAWPPGIFTAVKIVSARSGRLAGKGQNEGQFKSFAQIFCKMKIHADRLCA